MKSVKNATIQVHNFKGQSHMQSRTNHLQITHKLGLCVLVRREIG